MIGLYQKHFLSPVGWLTLTANNSGLCSLQFEKQGSQRSLSEFLDHAATQLTEYFQGRLKTFIIPLHLEGTPFQKDVWQCLSRIPYGVTPSYSDIAAQIGRPSAVRAVGKAVNANPLLIILPCHRVIGKNGDLAGYAAGIEVKRKLLHLELNRGHNVEVTNSEQT